MSAGAARVALVGRDRQLYLTQDGGPLRQLTWPWTPGALVGWGSQSAPSQEGRSLPTFSPDGRWLACFQLDGASEDAATVARVCVLAVDGVEEQVLVELERQLPVYLQWHPDGRHLAVLVQEEDSLQLWLCARDRLGFRQPIAEGVPLFFAWDPALLRILLHTGEPATRGGQLLLRDLRPTGEDTVLSAPGSFCTPFFLGTRTLYVTFQGGLSHVCLDAGTGQPPQILTSLPGLLAVVPDPQQQRVAVAIAPSGAQQPYQHLLIFDLQSGAAVASHAVAHRAFFWLPGGEALLLAQPAPGTRGQQWSRLEVGGTQPPEVLAQFWPTREQLFHLRFFEQYCASHPLLSPDGRTLLYAGLPDPARAEAPTERLWTLDLSAEHPQPEVLAEGSFGVFAPPSPALP